MVSRRARIRVDGRGEVPLVAILVIIVLIVVMFEACVALAPDQFEGLMSILLDKVIKFLR